MYVRVSTKDQEEKYGLSSQVSTCHKFANNNNYTIVNEYTDSMTGQTADRPGIKQALADANKGLYETLIIYDHTRLGRKLLVSAQLREDFEEADVKIVTASLGELPKDSAIILDAIMDGYSHYEITKLSQRTSAGRRKSAEAGNIVTTKRLLGYNLCKDHEKGRTWFEINEDEAPTVKRIFRMFNEGNSLKSIAGTLEDEGVSKGTGTATWSSQNLRERLGDTTYIGEWRYGKSKVVSKGSKKTRHKTMPEHQIIVPCPAIIDKETFEKTQIKLSSNRRRAKSNIKHDYLMRGRIFCRECGVKYYSRTTNKRWGYYTHDEYGRPKTDCDNKVHVPIKVIDEPVEDFIIEAVTDPDFATKEFERHQKEKETYYSDDLVELETIMAKINALRAQALNAEDMLTRETFSLEQYNRQIERIDEEQSGLVKRAEELQVKLEPIQTYEWQYEGDASYWTNLIDEGKDISEEDFYGLVRMAVDFDELVVRLDCKAYVSKDGKIELHSKLNEPQTIVIKDGLGWKHIV